MSEISRSYFVAQGKSLQICEAFFAEVEEKNEQQGALLAEVKASSFVRSEGQLVGFLFDEPPADSKTLRSRKMSVDFDGTKSKVNVWLPNLRAKAGKQLQDRMSSTTLPTLATLTARLVGNGRNPLVYMYASRIYYITIERLGDQVILAVPELPIASALPPEDAVPLKRSAYWKMREDQEGADADAETH